MRTDRKDEQAGGIPSTVASEFSDDPFSQTFCPAGMKAEGKGNDQREAVYKSGIPYPSAWRTRRSASPGFRMPLLYTAFIAARSVRATTPNSSISSGSFIQMAVAETSGT